MAVVTNKKEITRFDRILGRKATIPVIRVIAGIYITTEEE